MLVQIVCKVKVSKQSSAVHKHPQRYENLRAYTDHTAEVTFLPLREPIQAGSRFSDPGGMQG